MTRLLTRVCPKCRHRKPLGQFRRSGSGHGYGPTCHGCTPAVRRRLLTKRCVKCRVRKYLSHFKKHPETSDGHDNRCKACVRRLYGRPRRAGLCVDCGKPCHRRRRRCEPCRVQHQAAVTAIPESAPPTICVLPTWHGRCGQALSFGTDFLGRTTMVCNVHGETLMPVIGRRVYSKGIEFEDDLPASVEVVSLDLNEYLSRGAA